MNEKIRVNEAWNRGENAIAGVIGKTHKYAYTHKLL